MDRGISCLISLHGSLGKSVAISLFLGCKRCSSFGSLQRWHPVIGGIEVVLHRVARLVFHGADDHDRCQEGEELDERKHDERYADDVQMTEQPIIDLLEAALAVDIVAVQKIGLSWIVNDAISALRFAAGSRDFA